MAQHGQTRSRSLTILGIGTGAALLGAAAVATALAATPPPRTTPPQPAPQTPPPAAPATPPPPTVPATPPADAYVELFDEAALQGDKLTLRPGNDIRSLDGVPMDNGVDGFEDRAASVRWNIPVGWQLVLFEHKNFQGSRHELKGTGRIETTPHLGCVMDSASSAAWERIQ